jgi:hypothetical protein
MIAVYPAIQRLVVDRVTHKPWHDEQKLDQDRKDEDPEFDGPIPTECDALETPF